MSRTTTRICDRCRGILVEQGSIIEIQAGVLTKQLPDRTLDLCSDCEAGFLDWLRSGNSAPIPPTKPDHRPVRLAAAH